MMLGRSLGRRVRLGMCAMGRVAVRLWLALTLVLGPSPVAVEGPAPFMAEAGRALGPLVSRVAVGVTVGAGSLLRAAVRLVPAGGLALGSAGSARADHGLANGQSFTFLQAGFTQEVFGVAPVFLGGVAFAPDGDPIVTSGTNLAIDCGLVNVSQRFDRQGVATEVNGTRLHPRSAGPSDLACGIVTHPNGALYTTTASGVKKVDPTTGAVLAGPIGSSGNRVSLAIDPQTGNLVFGNSSNTLHVTDPGLVGSTVFSTVTTSLIIDGMAFDPTGQFLFVARRSAGNFLMVLKRDGTLAQQARWPSR